MAIVKCRDMSSIAAQVWPDVAAVSVSSPPIPMLEYANEELSLDTIVCFHARTHIAPCAPQMCAYCTRHSQINIMVGDTQRIPVYAQKGFQIPQPMPPE